MPTRTPAMSGIAWVLLLTLSVLWGATFFFWKVLVEYLPPFTVVFGRVGIASLVLIVVLALRGEALPLTRAAWLRFAIMAALNNAIRFALVAYGETAIASGLASILNAATPLFMVLVAHVLTDDETLTPLRVLGIGLGFLGVVVLVGPDLLGGLAANLLAETACLVAAIAYALAGVLRAAVRRHLCADRGNRPACRGDDAHAAAGDHRRSAVAASPPGMVWASLVATAVLCTAVGYPVYFRLFWRSPGRRRGFTPASGARIVPRRRRPKGPSVFPDAVTRLPSFRARGTK